MRMKIIYAALAAIPVTLLAFSTGPPIKRTGTIDGGGNCSACHRDQGAANSDPLGSVKLENLQPYQPGVAQTVKVTISHPNQSAALFDRDGGYVKGAAESVDLKLFEETLGKTDTGLTLRWEFDVKPGDYLVRLVVREAAGTAMTTLNRTVKML
jgi:hypothetical protein